MRKMAFIGALTILLSVSTIVHAEDKAVAEDKTYTLGVFIFPGFELLDAMGPLEMLGNVGPQLKIVMFAPKAGEVASYQKIKVVADYSIDDVPECDLLLVPGGFGALQLVGNAELMGKLNAMSAKSEITTSVCNGSQILAAAGILDGRKATTNKMYYNQIVGAAEDVNWVKEARWVDDGNIITSSGVSAGIDMSLHLISRLFGEEAAVSIAQVTEYQWHRDADVDPFAKFVN